MVATAFLTIAAYLFGSIPTAWLLVWAVKRQDVTRLGSGSVSASNAGEVLGKWAMVTVGCLDIFKGAIPLWLARGIDLSLAQQMSVGVAVVAGHNWSVFLGFRGGRGLATLIGVLLATMRLELLLFIIIAVFGYTVTSNVPLWLGLAAALTPFWSYALEREEALVWGGGVMVGLVFIKRLLGNWEPLPAGGKIAVVFYRLLLDRDTRQREPWVRRGTPGQRADLTPDPLDLTPDPFPKGKGRGAEEEADGHGQGM